MEQASAPVRSGGGEDGFRLRQGSGEQLGDQASNSVIVWTSQNIAVSRYREGTMLVRVHALNIGTTATLVVALRAVQPSQEGSTGTTLTATLSADLSLKDD